MKTIPILIALSLVLALARTTAQEPAQEPTGPEVSRPDDVPIVPPGTLKAKEPPPSRERPLGEQALLPFNLVENKIDSLRIGDSGFVATAALKADTARRCWLDPYALYGPRSADRTVEVRRDASGFHVVLPGTDHRWTAQDLETYELIPVRTIAVHGGR